MRSVSLSIETPLSNIDSVMKSTPNHPISINDYEESNETLMNNVGLIDSDKRDWWDLMRFVGLSLKVSIKSLVSFSNIA